MNRRKFLQGVAAIGAAAVLPKVDVPEPRSGFDNWIASYPPQRAMTAADLDKGVEMLRDGWPGHGYYTGVPPLDNFGISAEELSEAVKRAVIDALREST